MKLNEQDFWEYNFENYPEEQKEKYIENRLFRAIHGDQHLQDITKWIERNNIIKFCDYWRNVYSVKRYIGNINLVSFLKDGIFKFTQSRQNHIITLDDPFFLKDKNGKIYFGSTYYYGLEPSISESTINKLKKHNLNLILFYGKQYQTSIIYYNDNHVIMG